MNYVTTAELAKMWNISTRMIIFYCEDGRIAGAEKKGRAWLIPADAQKTADKRPYIRW